MPPLIDPDLQILDQHQHQRPHSWDQAPAVLPDQFGHLHILAKEMLGSNAPESEGHGGHRCQRRQHPG